MDIRCGDRITFRVCMAASFQIFILYGIEGGNEPDLGSVITQPDFPSVEILERLPESLRITVCQYWIVCGPFSPPQWDSLPGWGKHIRNYPAEEWNRK